MGLLDDAIREHLELKRKHGANPEDVARQEQEALGPGQRNEFAQPEQPEQPVVPEPELQEPEPEPPAAIAAGAVDELPEGEPGIEEEPPAAVAPGYDEDPWLDDDPDHAFPSTWTIGGSALPVEYVFDPASDRDGVIVQVPVSSRFRIGKARWKTEPSASLRAQRACFGCAGRSQATSVSHTW